MSSKLDKYLQSVAHELRGLPEHKREEELREMQQHLETIIARGIESGASEDDATHVALQQFGSAREVGRKLRSVGLRRESVGRVVAAPLCGVLGNLVLIGAVLSGMHLLDGPPGFLPNGVLQGYPNHLPTRIAYSVLMLLTTVGGGVIAGRIAPRSAIWSAPATAVALGVASTMAFPFPTSPLVLLQRAIEIFIGAWIGSQWAQRRVERA